MIGERSSLYVDRSSVVRAAPPPFWIITARQIVACAALIAFVRIAFVRKIFAPVILALAAFARGRPSSVGNALHALVAFA